MLFEFLLNYYDYFHVSHRPVAFRERVDLHVECTWRHWRSRKLRPHVSERTCNAMLAHETITLNR